MSVQVRLRDLDEIEEEVRAIMARVDQPVVSPRRAFLRVVGVADALVRRRRLWAARSAA